VKYERSKSRQKHPGEPPSTGGPRLGILIGIGLLLVACLGIAGLVWSRSRSRPQAQVPAPAETLVEVAAAATRTPLPTATITPSPTTEPTPPERIVPTETLAAVAPECEQGYLFAAGRVFEIELLAPMADGSLRLPQGTPEAAYYVDGGTPQNSAGGYAFFLNDTPENQALLDSSQAGSPVSILWRGCILEESTLLGIRQATAEGPPAFDPASPGVTLYLVSGGPAALPLPPTPTIPSQPASTSTPVPQPTSIAQPTNTPAPTIPPPQGTIEAEIGFENKQVSASTITLTISVYNYGPNPFTLYSTDVLLVTPGGSRVALGSSVPALPSQFPSGASQTFSFSFPNPGGSGIVFQIFNVEFDLDDF
jgi:hypothetical protein